MPYRGAAPALNDLMGAQLNAAEMTRGDRVQHDKAGRLRLLAASGLTRSSFAPALATFSEQKMPGLDVRDGFGVYIADMAACDVVAHVAHVAHVAPLVHSACASAAYTQALDRLARVDFDRWTPVVKASVFVADV